MILCSDDEEPAREHLVQTQFGMHRFEWPEGGIEFHIPHGEWIRLLREHGFEIERAARDPGAAGRRHPRALRLRDRRVGPPLARRGTLASQEAMSTGS